MVRTRLRAAALLPLYVALAASVSAQTPITTPMQAFGHNIGDDYFLANYTQLTAYWQKLAHESDRMVLDTIGKSAEGRPQLMAIITSPANHANLARYKEISRRLALAKDLTDEQAHQLAREGKAVVWIDGGLHATEVLGAHQLMETVYQLVSRNDPETLRLLDDLIILAVQVNPDGMELVSNWYMRETDPEKRSTGGLPVLYQKYVGHDDNRDFYAVTQPETKNDARILYREWFPVIVYNHHQTGPAGTVMFAPPFRDPYNYHFDGLMPVSIELVGSAMFSRFIAEGKPGVTMRSGSSYSTWWNGGLRTEAYFHNMIGLLTETIGNPTPTEIPFIPSKQLPSNDLPFPIEPQAWHFRQSIDYSLTANWAVMDIASRRKDEFLFNMYRMGKNAIERGSEDHWTNYPRRVEAAEAALRASRSGRGNGNGRGGSGRGGVRGTRADFERLLHDPAKRDARGYIIPSDQPRFLTAVKFVNTLIENGVSVQRATSTFQVGGKTYPAGSLVVKTAQSFRAHVLDMFEPQDHPDDFPYPGGPPIPPYDNAGWTLAYQMNVRFDRVLDAFDGPFEDVKDVLAPPPGHIAGSGKAGYLLSHQVNDAFVAVNSLLAAKQDVYWLDQPVTVDGQDYPAGTFYIPAKSSTRRALDKLAADVGLDFQAVAARPHARAFRLRAPRIALWDRYGGSMPSGWVRWLLEQYRFPYQLVFPKTLDAGDLDKKYDAIVFVDGAIPSTDRAGRGGGFGNRDPENIPEEYRDRLGSVTVANTVPQLRQFLEKGGTILTIGSSTNLAADLGLPVQDALVEAAGDSTRHLPNAKFYVPGSVLQARVDDTLPIAHGLDPRVDFFFDNSPVFKLGQDAAAAGLTPISWFDTGKPLRSGWAWGQEHLEGGVAAARASVGKGTLYLFGPEITFRGQPHGTFKFLFNGLYLSTARETDLK